MMHFLLLCLFITYQVLNAQSPIIGCFVDRPNERDFTDGSPIRLPTMTQQVCIAHCLELKTKFAGVQGGDICGCANHDPKFPRAPEGSCRTPCSGDARQVCGGTLMNLVLRTGWTPPSTTNASNPAVVPSAAKVVDTQADSTAVPDETVSTIVFASVTGSVAVLAILAVVGLVYFRRKRQSSTTPSMEQDNESRFGIGKRHSGFQQYMPQPKSPVKAAFLFDEQSSTNLKPEFRAPPPPALPPPGMARETSGLQQPSYRY